MCQRVNEKVSEEKECKSSQSKIVTEDGDELRDISSLSVRWMAAGRKSVSDSSTNRLT